MHATRQHARDEMRATDCGVLSIIASVWLIFIMDVDDHHRQTVRRVGLAERTYLAGQARSMKRED